MSKEFHEFRSYIDGLSQLDKLPEFTVIMEGAYCAAILPRDVPQDYPTVPSIDGRRAIPAAYLFGRLLRFNLRDDHPIQDEVSRLRESLAGLSEG